MVHDLSNVPLFMSPAKLSELTGEHEGSIRRGIREGRIPADKVNGRWLICRDKVFSSLSERSESGTDFESTCRAGT